MFSNRNLHPGAIPVMTSRCMEWTGQSSPKPSVLWCWKAMASQISRFYSYFCEILIGHILSDIVTVPAKMAGFRRVRYSLLGFFRNWIHGKIPRKPWDFPVSNWEVPVIYPSGGCPQVAALSPETGEIIHQWSWLQERSWQRSQVLVYEHGGSPKTIHILDWDFPYHPAIWVPP